MAYHKQGQGFGERSGGYGERSGGYGRGRDDDRGFKKPGFGRRSRQCKFCSDKEIDLSYKNTEVLAHYITEKGKIIPRRISGNCAKHQRWMAREIKRARQLALIPYVSSFFFAISDR